MGRDALAKVFGGEQFANYRFADKIHETGLAVHLADNIGDAMHNLGDWKSDFFNVSAWMGNGTLTNLL